MLWVDGVGGFLLCPGPQVWMGRAVVAPNVELPVAADIQRRHARIVWHEGEHWLAATGPSTCNGSRVAEPRLLRHGDRVGLGDAVMFQYLQPPLLGDTALFNALRPARAIPGCDGIVLLGKTLVLGQAPAAHIDCRELKRSLVLVHRSGTLYVQSKEWIEVDGRRGRGWLQLHDDSRLVCEDLAISLEPCQRPA